tara:strand:- start:1961 stop:2269 length:309 start_codon:yes stop_codon:yes gene_type:complete
MAYYETQGPSVLEDAFMTLADRIWDTEEQIYSQQFMIDTDDIHQIHASALEESVYKSLRIFELEIALIPYKMWCNSCEEIISIEESVIRTKRELCYKLSFVE